MTNRNYEMPDWSGLGGDAEEPLLSAADASRPQAGYYGYGGPPQGGHQTRGQQPEYAPQHLPRWLGNSMTGSPPHPPGGSRQESSQFDRGGIATSFNFDVGGLGTQYMQQQGMGADGVPWSPPRIDDLDLFFSSMYAYYQNRGLPAILLNQFCNTATLGFTIAFSVFLLACVDWHRLRHCHDEASCDDFYSYVRTPFGQATLYNFVTFCYMALFFVYWLFQLLSAARTSLEGIRMESFYRRVLGISLSDLQNMMWSDVMRRLITLHDNGVYRVSIQEKLTEYDIVARIMRKDNYMVALINKGVLDIRLPRWIVQCSMFMWEDSEKTLFLTKSLEWSINFCVLQFMFNENAVMTEEFLRDVKGLQYRFVRVGALQLLLMPFMLVFMIIHFFLENAQQFRSSQSYLGPRHWSPLAMWMFREYNELPHIFEARINMSYEGANKYVGLFTNGYAATLAKFVAYISGSFVAVLVLVSVIDEAVLLYVRLSDHNLLWFLGIFSGIFAAAASFIPSQSQTALIGGGGSGYTRSKGSGDQNSRSGVVTTPAEQTMEVVAAHTHHFPRYWMHQCHTLHVRDEFLKLFPYKTKLFAMEVLSVLLTPLVLCFSLPNCVPEMLAFMSRHTKYLDGVGDVCDYSTFDFDAYGNSEFLSPVEGDVGGSDRSAAYADHRASTDSYVGSAVERRVATDIMNQRDRDSDGKLEQSYMSFRIANPDWHGVVGPSSDGARQLPNWDGPKVTGPGPLGGMHRQGISISSPLRGKSQGDESKVSLRAGDHPGAESATDLSRAGTAGDVMMNRIRKYRYHMTGGDHESVLDSITKSIVANTSRSAAGAVFPRVENSGHISRVPPLHPQSANKTIGEGGCGTTALPGEMPSLKNLKNQASRESDVSSVLDPSSGGSRDDHEESSDVEEVNTQLEYSLTVEERDHQQRLFGNQSGDQSITESQIGGYADVIDRSCIDRFVDGRQMSSEDSMQNSIASILKNALRGEGGESYENDFYWLNKYRSERVRQSIGSAGSIRTDDATSSQVYGSSRSNFSVGVASSRSQSLQRNNYVREHPGLPVQHPAGGYYSSAFHNEVAAQIRQPDRNRQSSFPTNRRTVENDIARDDAPNASTDDLASV